MNLTEAIVLLEKSYVKMPSSDTTALGEVLKAAKAVECSGMVIKPCRHCGLATVTFPNLPACCQACVIAGKVES